MPWFLCFHANPSRTDTGPDPFLCLFQKYLVLSRDALQLCWERCLLWERHSNQLPPAGLWLDHRTMPAQVKPGESGVESALSPCWDLPTGRDLHYAWHNCCCVQRSLEECTCLGCPLKSPPLSWSSANLSASWSLKFPYSLPLGISCFWYWSTSSLFSGHWLFIQWLGVSLSSLLWLFHYWQCKPER